MALVTHYGVGDRVQCVALDQVRPALWTLSDVDERGLLAGLLEWHTRRFGLLYFGRDRDGA